MIYILYIIAGIIPFQIALNPASGFDVALIRIIIIIAGVVWLIRSIISDRIIFVQSWVFVGIIIFISIAGLSFVNVQEWTWFLRKLFFLLNFGILFVIISSFSWNNASFVRFIHILVISSILVSSIGIIFWLAQFIVGADVVMTIWTQYITPLFFGHSFSHAITTYSSAYVAIGGHVYLRLVSLFPDPHICAFYNEMILPMAIAVAGMSYGYRRFLWGVGSFIISIAIILTFTRGAYVALGVGGIIAGIIFLWRMRYSISIFIGMFTGVFAILCILMVSPIGERFISITDLSDNSVNSRLILWGQAFDSIIQHPFIGVGLGNYILTAMPYADYRIPYYAHNIYLDIMAEMGIIAGIIWILCISTAIVHTFHRAKVNPLSRAFGFSLILFSVHSLFDTALFSVQVLPLLMIVLACSILPQSIYQHNE